jgi:hypothetical protein
MSALETHYRQLLGIARGWAVKHLPGFDDECHRALIARYGAGKVNGRVSALAMSVKQIGAALSDYERIGWPREKKWRPAAGGASAPRNVPPRVALIVRLWGKLGQAGKVANPSRPALLAFVRRQTGREVADLDSLSTEECQAVTEALKGWFERARRV